MARILVMLLAFALLGGAVQAPDLASPSSALVDDLDVSVPADLPAAVVIPSPERQEIAASSQEVLAPRHVFPSSIFRPPRAVTFS